jgi:calcium-dependent protein kinase
MARPSAAQALRHKWLVDQLGLDGVDKHASAITHRSIRTGHFTSYLAMKKLKKAALGYIASNLTQSEVGTLKEIFQAMDKNRDGLISLSDLDSAIERGRFSERILQDLQELRSDLAISGDVQIDWRDFVASTMDRSVALREDNVRMAFEHFRHSHAEYLTIDDLADIFEVAHAQEVMDVLDTDRDGKVSFEDFRRALAESMENDDEDSEIVSDPEIIS